MNIVGFTCMHGFCFFKMCTRLKVFENINRRIFEKYKDKLVDFLFNPEYLRSDRNAIGEPWHDGNIC